MKSFLQILALESRLFETLLKRRSGQAECSGGLLFVFSSLVPQRRYTLDCPREEILVNPPPSYIFVMNEDLCGVYPTPTGVYIRKPLERGEEVMVLQPGFQGTKAVYYYNNDKSQLFVLCEDNRKLIIHDLITEKSVAYSILGLPGNGSRSSKNADLVCNPLFAFFLAGTGHLFCIDLRTVDDDALQAKLIWTSPHSASPESSYGTVRCMTGAPEAVMVTMAHVGDITTYFLGIEHPEKPPLYFTELCKTVNSLGLHLPSDHAVIIPFDDHLNGFVMRTYEHGCSYRLSLLSDLGRSIDIGYRLPTRQSLQIVIGAKDVIYLMRQDTSMVPAAYEPSDGGTALGGAAKRRRTVQAPCWISTHYVFL
ncbi:hypothetical protein FOZ62_005816 [Perkinsus olseni]|uniref:Uncharacterized protein n=1 Tax=Perkinsus olseni TaxID=32597 RepID=A0A7J6QQG2_PEROL|nr:hypothetical protein FOZ62_005816 [Perkinsus olseni]